MLIRILSSWHPDAIRFCVIASEPLNDFRAKRIPRTVNPRPAQAWQASVAELLPDSFSFVGLPYGSLRFGQNVMS